MSDKIQHLKESLSQTLVTFYPFAGIIRDALSADCNDQGLPFFVAKVKARLSDFLQNPNVELTKKFFPREEKLPGPGDSVMLIQLNCFDCGSIALCIKFNHIIADMGSASTFLQRWAANAQGLGFAPLNCVAQSSFPQKPSLPNNLTPINLLGKYLSAGKFMWRRYVFDASALSILKAQMSSSSPSSTVSRVNVVTAVMLKCFLETVAAEKDVKPVVMTQGVNLRRRVTPPFPDDSFGNLVWPAVSLWRNPEEKELTELVREVKKGIEKIDGEFVSRLGSDGVYELLEALRNEMPQEGTWLAFTSWANIGLSEVDFGWGKPVWMSGYIPQYYESETMIGGNFVILLDSNCGGIEAWSILNEKYIAGFEKNDHIRKYARFNPSVI
ncbi:stemmadenine O-acetyltransferase-like [Salvia hispanica]|uniref:stemmadenine O-acetyltransferase-like n=1 Tax=Salvia hispanica TaxID=49212 RepID=UPI002009352C|nr:stemmadenine O-acetyltransferase-like [Salvia hispanica]